jgi:hypothetical protein
MYKLARMHLDSVGSNAARFSNLTLDFTDVEHDPLDTIIWLRNGGGKTSLLSLLFSLFLPNRRDFLGARDDRKTLGDYVLSGDTAHVLCEWDTPHGPLVTAAVYEWPERRRPTEHEMHAGELVTRFYLYRPTPGVLTFDERPVREASSKRHSLEAYVRELRAIGRSQPMTDLVVATTGAEWKQALLERGIDSAVFRYQKEMNKGEGAIDEQFRFTTGEAFVNFLIDMAVDPDASESVSSRMTQLADKLAKRPATALELAYCEGVAERLGPIAASWSDLGRHRAQLDDATAAGSELSAGLRAAHEVAGRTEEAAETQRGQAALRARVAETARTTARDRGREFARRAAQFWVSDATTRAESLEADKADLEGEQAGWAALEDLFSQEHAERQMADIDRQLSERAADAEPLRESRNNAARRLHWRYVDLHESTARERDDVLTRAVESDGQAEVLGSDAMEAVASAARLSESIASRRGELEAIDTALTDAVAAGHLVVGEAPQTALTRAQSSRSDATAALQRLEATIDSGTLRQNELVNERTALGAETTRVSAARDADDVERSRLEARAEALRAHARIAELAQSDVVSLWGAYPMLDGRLAEEIDRSDADLLAERLESERDRRNLAALGAGGLLPPSEDTTAVLGILADAGISAVAGLAYLSASVPRRQWDDTMEAHPGLLAGVLVDAADFERAAGVLIDAGLHPASLVTIAKKSDLGAGGEEAFVVPPSPALYDTVRADEDRKVLDARLSDLDRRTSLLVAAREADRALRDEMRHFIDDCPTGHLDALTRRIAEHDRTLADLGERKNTLEAEATELADELTGAGARRSVLTATLLELAGRVSALESLTARVATRAQLLEELELAGAGFNEANERAATAQAGATEARRAAEALRADGATLAYRIAELAGLLDGVVLRDGAEGKAAWGEAAWGEADARATTTPTESLERELRDRDEEYQGKVSDPVLDERRRRATEDRAVAQAALERRGPAARTRAEALRTHPAALDAPSRARRVAELGAQLEELLRAQGEARADLAAAEARTRELTPSDRQVYRELSASEIPLDRADAEGRQGESESEATRQQLLVSEAEREVAEAAARRDAARTRKELVAVLADSLDNLIPNAGITPLDVPQQPAHAAALFAGSDEEARAAQSAATSALKEAGARFADTETTLGSLVSALRAFAARSDFEAAGSLREAIVVGEVADVSRRAAELATAHDTRAAVLRADLDAISADQEILVTDLADQTRRVLDLLNKAPATSTMDKSLGAWGGKSFLTINFEDISAQPDELSRRVSAEVDAIVAKGGVPDGLSTLKRAVHAAVPGGFRVRVLKPTADLHEERVPVSAMAKWSGGEKLTAAVVLYCIIARLRARNRSRALATDSSGALVLDNPLGKASYVGFLALQRRVATALGVQLLYTTAVRDLKAVGTFPNVIRCQNRRPAGSERGFVTANERAGDAHGSSLEGLVSSARVVRLEPPLEAEARTADATASGDGHA